MRGIPAGDVDTNFLGMLEFYMYVARQKNTGPTRPHSRMVSASTFSASSTNADGLDAAVLPVS
jgi:hypothetical protein